MAMALILGLNLAAGQGSGGEAVPPAGYAFVFRLRNGVKQYAVNNDDVYAVRRSA